MCFDELTDLIEKFSKNMLKKNKGTPLAVNLSLKTKKTLIDKYLKSKSSYRRSLMTNMNNFLNGNITEDEFIALQKSAISLAYTDSYSLGKAFGTGGNSVLDDTERRFIVYQTTKEVDFMKGFASDLLHGEGTLPYKRRMEMYVAGLDSMFGFGRLVQMPEDVTIIWKLGSTDKHCVDCLMFAAHNPYTKRTLPGYPKSGNSRCFVGKRNMYRILTPDGWKHIGEIKIGDLVLSHKGKWKKVLNVIDEDCKDEFSYEIVFKTAENKKPIRVFMLNDHLSITHGKWVRADELKIGDSIMFVGHKCKHCGKTIKYDDQRGINFEYCSIGCSSKAIDKWKKGREKIIEKYGELGTALKEWKKVPENMETISNIGRVELSRVQQGRIGKTYEEMYGKEKADDLRIRCPKAAHEKTRQLVKLGSHPFQKFMGKMSKAERSEFCRAARANLTQEDFLNFLEERINERIKKGTFKYTKPEKQMILILDSMNIKWFPQKRFETNFFDFYLPDSDVYIEVDGDFIHANPKMYSYDNLKPIQKKQKIRDFKKDDLMERNKKTLIRFWENDLYNDVDSVKNKLNLILNNHNENFVGYHREIISINKIKVSSMVGKRVLSLTVEDDESYVTNNGLIAHNCLSNCRCELLYYYNSNQTSSDYDNFILNKYNTKKDIPTEDQYKTLIGYKEAYYFNRLKYELTKDTFYKDEYVASLDSIKEFCNTNNVVFDTTFPIQAQLTEVKQFVKSQKFDLALNHVNLQEGQLVSIFNSGVSKYGKIDSKLGADLQVKFLDSTTMNVDFKKSTIFGEI